MSIGVAVSGGGHRATAWALGALAALVETGASAHVTAVSSVSGGSIANGAVAALGDFRQQRDSSAFARGVGPVLRMAAVDGLFFHGPATRAYLTATLGLLGLWVIAGVGLVAALVAAGRESQLWGYAVFGGVAGAGIGFLIGGLTRRARAVSTPAGAVLGALAAWAGAGVTGGLHGGGLWVALVALGVVWLVLGWAAVALFSQRGKAVARALGRGPFAHPTEDRPLTLADLTTPVNHVVCATDLESGDQFYLAPRFLYGFREGISTTGPGMVTLGTAVQASASLPGAFPPAIVETGSFTRHPSVEEPPTPPSRVVLVDGGVYDNMGDQWELGLATRLTKCEQLRAIQEPVDVLVVANASAGWVWKPWASKGRVGFELTGLMRDQGVQYDVSTSRRRNQLVERFRASAAAGSGLVGVIAMIDRIPMSLARPFMGGTDDVARRAAEAETFLDAQRSEDEWKALAKRNADVPTTLGAIGAQTTLELLEHAYTLTMVGLYVMHGIGRLAPFPHAAYASVIGDEP